MEVEVEEFKVEVEDEEYKMEFKLSTVKLFSLFNVSFVKYDWTVSLVFLEFNINICSKTLFLSSVDVLEILKSDDENDFAEPWEKSGIALRILFFCFVFLIS